MIDYDALDAQIVNVALLAIRASLGGGLSGLQWVVTGYTVMFASLQLLAGTFADRVASRRANQVGMIIFVVASAACAAAPTLPMLIAARIVQGTGAALVTPSSVALIREAFTDRAARGRAIAYWRSAGPWPPRLAPASVASSPGHSRPLRRRRSRVRTISIH